MVKGRNGTQMLLSMPEEGQSSHDKRLASQTRPGAWRPWAKLPGGSGQRAQDSHANGGPSAPHYPPARRVSFSELLGGSKLCRWP